MAEAGPSQQELDSIEAEYQQGITLIAKDPEQACEVLGKVLELRNQHHGDMSEDCAETYLWYARALLEQARCSTDALTSRPRPKAAEAGPSGSADAAPEPTKDTSATGGAEAEPEPAAEASGDEDEGEQDGEEQEEEEEEEGQQGSNESDDLRLAYEMLELARLICTESKNPKLVSTLASVHLSLGDVASEKDDFDAALEEYGRCQALLEGVQPQDKRALAGAHFSTMLVLTLVDNLALARTHCKQAITLLEERRAEIMVVMDTPVEGETGEDADEEIDALEKQLDEIDASLKDLKERLEDLDSAIKEQASFRGVLKAAMQSMAAIQDPSGVPAAAATEGPDGAPAATAVTGGSAAAATAANAPLAPLVSTTATAGAADSAPTAPAVVQNLGVAGRGRTRITLQPCQPSAPTGGTNGAGFGFGVGTKPLLPAKRNIAEISTLGSDAPAAGNAGEAAVVPAAPVTGDVPVSAEPGQSENVPAV